MRKHLLALAAIASLLSLSGGEALAQSSQPASGWTQTGVAINIATATTTQLVAASSTKWIYVSHWDLFVGGSGNWQFAYGPNSSTLTYITGPYNFTAQTGAVVGDGAGVILPPIPPGNALYAVTSAAVQYSGSLTYSQF